MLHYFEKPAVYFGSLFLVIVIAAVILLSMGRIPWCECGYIKFWHSDPVSSENSQHVADPYTLTHVIHGIGFYALLKLLARRLPVGARLVLATILEAAWEIFENTDFVINRYRAATISLNYYGDSVTNTVGDILTNAFGFYLAYKFPVWLSVLLVIGLEVFLALWIRDSLFINIFMLIYPIEAIRNWQS